MTSTPTNLAKIYRHTYADQHVEYLVVFDTADALQVCADYTTHLPAPEYGPAQFRPVDQPWFNRALAGYYSPVAWDLVPSSYQRVMEADADAARRATRADLISDMIRRP